MDRSQGLTLVEVVTALALTGLVTALAAPSFATALAGARRSQAVNDFVHAIHLARTAAAETGRPAVLCAGSTDCSGSLDWSDRYLVFLDADRDVPPALDAGERVLWRADSTPAIRRRANRSAFIFEPTGRSGTTGTLVVCDTTGRITPRAVIVSRTGRPRTSVEDASGRVLRCP